MAGEDTFQEGWQVLKLGDLGKIVTGKTPSTKIADNFGGHIPFITPSDMDGRRIIAHTARYLTEQGAASVSSARIPKGTVMVSCIGSDMGKAAIAGCDAVTNQQINSIIVGKGISNLYAYYNLSIRKSEIQHIGSGGSAVPILNKGHFSQLQIALPPLAEQQAIACILGALDDKIELNRRMNETLEAMARAIFKSWFVDFLPVRAKRRGEPPCSLPHIADLFPDEFMESELGKIPKGWRIGTLGQIIEIHDSKRVPLSRCERSKRQGPYRYYGAASIIDYVDDYLFDGVYVLVGEDGSVVTDQGNPVVQYVWGKFWVNNHAHVLKGVAGVSDEHLMLLLQNVYVVPYVTGAVQPKLSQTNLKAIPAIQAPPAINKAFRHIVEPLFAELRLLHDQNISLTSIRDTLLPKLISGELRVPDAERIVGRCA
jgi:type I restriction enzyme S subunit